jgi:hypothetical protein
MQLRKLVVVADTHDDAFFFANKPKARKYRFVCRLGKIPGRVYRYGAARGELLGKYGNGWQLCVKAGAS